ncbi:hypothetical protein NESM_000421900 [Novymonas esmeraldas]|uniref:Clu domain-containing protein n=1 Tax=Novymonas esmeraldas TaxID=1808958 RepID=A0AAW0ELL3_9TRYP
MASAGAASAAAAPGPLSASEFAPHKTQRPEQPRTLPPLHSTSVTARMPVDAGRGLATWIHSRHRVQRTSSTASATAGAAAALPLLNETASQTPVDDAAARVRRGSSPSTAAREHGHGARPAPPLLRDPVLTAGFATAHLPFLAASDGRVDRGWRDWNTEFQWLWAEQLHGELWGYASSDNMRNFLDEFEGFGKELVEVLGREGRLPVATRLASSTAMCARYGNVLVHTWPDGKHGMWMQRSFRALLECGVPHLSLPLMATFRYFGDVVTVAVVVAFDRTAPPTYSGSGRPDMVVHMPLQELLDMAQDALNISRADEAAAAAPAAAAAVGTGDGAAAKPPLLPSQRKVRGVEVREGVDARLYVVNCLGLLPPLISTAGRALTLRRWVHLIQHGPATPASGGGAGLDVYRRDAAAAVPLLSAALQAPVEKRNSRLVQLLHESGLNVALLGLIAQLALTAAAREDLDDTAELVLRLIAVEMLARAVRRSLFRSMEREGGARTLPAANALLQRTAGSLLRTSQSRFSECLLPLVRAMFWLDEALDTGAVEQLLKRALRSEVVQVTRRLCELCGLRVVRGNVAEILCQPSHHNFSSFYTAEHQALLATLAQDESEYPPAFTTAFLLPLRIRWHCRSGRLAEAWREATRLVEQRGRALSQRFLNADAWTTAALIAAHTGRREDSDTLITRATRVLFDVPAFLIRSAAPQVRVPAHLYFLRGQIHAKLAHGFICVQQRRFEAAEERFSEALRLPDVLEAERQPHLAHLRQQAVVGLFSIAVHADEAKVRQIDAQWSAELRSTGPSVQGARISELFGSLFFDRDMFPSAVARLWECLEATEQLLGPTAFRVGEVLNRLAYVYYRWDARQYGLFCSCILHRAEAIMVERSGLYSPLHLSIVENIVSLLILRGMFVAASRRLHLLRTLPPRYTGRVSREHPALVRISEISAHLREEFSPIAIVIIQRYWREYRSRALLHDVYDTNAREIQRLGRAFLVRRSLQHLCYGCIAADDVALTAQRYALRTFSRPLICAAALFSKEHRHWNSEAQHPRLFTVWWDQVEQQVQRDERQRLVTEFEAAARECLHGMRNGSLCGVPVPGCSTSVVMRNIVFTQIPVGHRMSALQLRLIQHQCCNFQCPMTVPLATLVEYADCAYYVEALIPLHHHPRVVFSLDGHSAGPGAEATRSVVHYLLRQYRHSGYTAFRTENCQGLEMVAGADGLLYLTNMLGLVSTLVHQQAPLDVASVELPRNVFSLAWEQSNAGRLKDAVDLLERALIARVADEHGLSSTYLLAYLASARFATGDDLDGATRLFQRCSAQLADGVPTFPAALILYAEGRAWLSRGSTKAAMDPLRRSLMMFADRIRLHAYHGAFCVFEVARWVLRANVMWEAKVDAAVLRCVAHAVEYGEPTLTLFTTCGRFILHTQKVGDAVMSHRLMHLRDTRVRELPPAELDRQLRVLLNRSDNLQRRGGNESHTDCVFALQTAIHMAEAAPVELRMLGVLLCSYGLLLTKMNRLKDARRALSRADAVLSKTVAPTSPEAMTWRKNNRTLQHRRRENAIAVIRRAVRLWKERRRVEQEMRAENPTAYRAVLAVRFQRRFKSLVVSEATARVHVADAQADECYQLWRRKGRMRNDAMLKQTYGTRIQILLDKLETATAAVAELALATKAVMLDTAWAMRQSILGASLAAAHRIERRGIIGAWRASHISVKLWHLEHVADVVRVEFLSAFHVFMLRCAAAEERAWRRVVVRNQRRSKRELGKAISRALRRKPKSATVLDLRGVLLGEARRREDVLATEEEEFRTLMDVFTFGPEVEEDDLVDTEDSL